jgi:predicted Zn-dependent protease
VKSLATFLLTALAVVVAAPAARAGSDDLPDIGNPAESSITPADEYIIGRMIVRGMRDQDQILEDPETTEYIESLGHRLSSQAHDGGQKFDFFVVKEPVINAFALPGGFVGVNSGLVLETKDESELAGVMAHEVAHVTQRHIARSLANQSRTSLVSTAAMLAAILLGAAAGGDAAIAGVSAAQTLALQQQVAFTRENEAEADRVGIGILGDAHFNPNGMSNFFSTLAREAGPSELEIPELIRTHPVTTARVAEAKERADQMHIETTPESPSYALIRERLRVLLTPAGQDPRAYYDAVAKNEADATQAQIYGKGLALVKSGHAAEAIPIFKRMLAAHPAMTQYYTALGQAELAAGRNEDSLKTLEHARELFPRNVPVTVRLGETLMESGQPKRAHEVLLDLFNAVPPTPEQAKLIAHAANAAGDVADAYYYMAEYHVMSGDLPLAINQLQLALSVPKLNSVQRARFRARLDEIQKALPKREQRRQQQSG